MTDSTALPVLPETTPAPVSFIPSSVSAREQRAREQLDGTIDGFIEKFSEKGFYPLGFEEIIFSLLPQLTEWPLDLQLKVDSERGNTLATYLKGTDPSVIKNSVSVEQDRYGEYVTSTVADDEALFQSIFDQLPVSSRLGVGGNFQGSSSTAGRIVTLRGQLVALLKAKRADVFEVLFAEAPRMKCNTNFSVHNPFLPLWKQHVSEDTPLFTQLLTFNPEVPAERLNAILEQHPLSEEQEQAFLDEYVLPVPFSEALDKSLAEWHKDRGLDGIFRTRTYNEDTDTLARTAAKDELKRLLDYDLWIVEVDADGSYLDDVPAYSTTSILLLHRGDGNYAVKNYHNDEISSFNVGTDSFYRAISSVLQPDQRLTLGMESETDIAGLRRLLGNAAAASNGGWYNPEHLLEVKKELLPDWMINASVGDKIVWNAAVDFYLQALRASQGSPLLSLSEYGDKTQLRAYARTQLRHKLDYDLGLRLDPDEIMVATYELSWTGNQEGSPGDIPFVRPLNDGESGFDGEATFRSLTDLCLENLGVFELNFRMTATFWDKHQRRIRDVSPHYIHQLVRKLNVGNSYAAFLKQRLLDSSLGQWHRDQYAQLMYAQMSLDAIEAKMAKDFADDSSLPSELQNRRYKWVMAVLDHATNSDASTAVEGHRIRAQTLVLKDSSSHDPLDFIPGTTDLLRQLDGLTLQGLLLIAPESNLSVPSVVLYTPMAPDNVSFREYASEKEMQDQLFNNPKLHDYLSGLVPPEQQQLLADILGTVKKQKNLKVRASPLNTTNIFIASYHAEVQRVIERVDTQTTSTGEANWQSAWKTAGKLVSLLLEFTPLKVRMPLAAARSIHAI
uniref:dermonecrotic toxin domain-containing protein n=1 Tax=Pseudomonas sp. TaxID=306 RepID=UPI0026321965